MQRIKSILFYVIVCLFYTISSLSLMAQQRSVEGTVIDADNRKPLSGVTVKVVDQSFVTSTDEDGRYSLSIGDGASTIEFSFVGYETVQQAIEGSTIDVTLSIASRDLQEVVVVAYGTSRRDNLTGSVSTINSKQLENRQVSSISRALEGQVSGLQSVASSGQPGTDATTRIRGIGSVNASSDPLYVVDGNPYAGDINAINPSDIESISVLKDAASSALYGSRGANGVIIITTKRGRSSGETAIHLNLTQGVSNRAIRDYDQVSTDEYFELYWEAIRNKNLSNGQSSEIAAQNASANLLSVLGINPYGSGFEEPVGVDGRLKNGATALWNDNWADVLQRKGHRTQADLNFSGGGDKYTYYLSGGYLNDQGIAIESSFKRYNVRANIDFQAKKWLNVGFNIAGSSGLQRYPQSEDSNTANIINFTRLTPSFYPYYERLPDGSYKEDDYGNRIWDFGAYRPSAAIPDHNLAASLPLDKNDIRRDNAAVRSYLEAVITPDVKFKSTYSVDYINYNTHDYTNPLLGTGIDTQGSVDKLNRKTIGQTWNNILTYTKQFDDHHLNLLAGHEYYTYQNENISGSRSGFVLPGFYEPVAASQLRDFTGSLVEYRLLSFLGRAEYNYANRYFLSGSLRTDGSSRFSPDKRWGTFWSVGASWKLSEEEFLKDSDWLNHLAWRVSYGGQGNDNLGTYYAYHGLYSILNSLGHGGTVTNRLPTPDLKWETNLNFNTGVDISFLNNRLAISAEYFIRKSKDLLFTMPMAISTGYSGYDANIGSLKNTGFDVEIKSVPVRKGDFRWNLDVNLSHYKNKITELPGEEDIPNGNKLLRIGGSIYDFYIPEWAGIDPETGNPQWYLADDNGDITDQTTNVYGDAGLFVQGSSLPKMTGGVNNSIAYKGFDFGALLSFSLGGQILDNDYVQLLHNGNNPGRSWSKEILNRWTPDNRDTDVPRLTTDNLSWTSASTRFLYDGSYARLKSVNLGYSLPQELTSKWGLGRLRVFLQGENLLTFFAHQGMDPEQTLNGATYFRYPAIKTFSGGVQLTL